MPYRTRIAPSPTGQFHIGNARTALFSYLLAKSTGGSFIIRIEDTDQNRLVEGAEEGVIRGLKWLGIDWDEGSDIGGQYAPYRQSERLEIYQKYVQELIDKGYAYYCFCTAERLDIMRKNQATQGLPPKYDRKCCSLAEEEIKNKLANGEKYVVRMKVLEGTKIKFTDLIRGEMEFDSKDIDDQVLRKSDGFPTYHLAAVVDDYLMKINLVSRTEEWLPSTPKHILLYQFFGWKAPQFAHLPFVVGKDRSKLSKRKDGEKVWLETYIKAGYLPEAMVNFLAFLGWNPKDDTKEFFTLEELIKEFRIENINKAGAYFDLEKLDYYNSYYLRQLSVDDLAGKCAEYLPGVEIEKIKKIIPLFQERMKKLSEINELADFLLNETITYDKEFLLWKKLTFGQVKNNLQQAIEALIDISSEEWGRNAVERKILELIANAGLSNGEMLWPMRVALTGKKASPGPFEVADVLGRTRTINRLNQAILLAS